MAFLTRVFTTIKPAELIDDINQDNNIVPNCEQIILKGDNNSIFQFNSELSPTEETYFDSFISSWIPPEDELFVDGVDDSTEASPQTVWSSQKVVNTIEDGFIGWRSIRSDIEVRSKKGSLNAYHTEMGNTGFYAYMFPKNKEAWVKYNVGRDYKPNGNMYMHLHWTTDGTKTKNVKWEIKYTIAKGHNQASGGDFFNPIHTVYMEDAASGVPWRHMVSESSMIDITNAEPNALILVHIKRVSASGGDNGDDIFGLQMELHYESDRHATPNRTPNFYI